MKIITNKFLINFEKMAVRRSLSKFLHGLKVDAIFKWVNRVQFDLRVQDIARIVD